MEMSTGLLSRRKGIPNWSSHPSGFSAYANSCCVASISLFQLFDITPLLRYKKEEKEKNTG
jgi:hypothetical protein